MEEHHIERLDRIQRGIADNDPDNVVLSDPFSDETRKTKRNLLAASLASLLLVAFDLRVQTFLGLAANDIQKNADPLLTPVLAHGLAGWLTVYFLINFVAYVYIDYRAWSFKKERQVTKPFTLLIQHINHNISTLQAHISDIQHDLHRITTGHQGPDHPSNPLGGVIFKIDNFASNNNEQIERINPLLDQWEKCIAKSKHLSVRLCVRLVHFWLIDVSFPIGLGVFAVYRTSGALIGVAQRVLSW